MWGAWLYQQHSEFMPPAAIILNVISLIVAYVPEGLPVTVTLTLVLIAKRMFAQNVLVRNLAIVETFNSLSLIATDKTGTLTQKQDDHHAAHMGHAAAVDAIAGRRPRRHPAPALATWQGLPPALSGDEAFKALVLGGALCNSSTVQSDDTGASQVLGDAADTALHNLLTAKLHLDPLTVPRRLPSPAALPFNSKNKVHDRMPPCARGV